ncbi:hypothetical protein P7C73_g5578, partial [Tremellales sp. Uapishka_1]
MSSDFVFDTEKIGDLSGKSIFITGGTGGLGKEAILVFAQHHASKIFFTGRNRPAAESLIANTKASGSSSQLIFLPADLGDLSSVKSAVDSFSTLEGQDAKVDVLILNAGIMAVPPALTKDGYELQFGTNHLGHALFARLLVPALQNAPAPRILSLTSLGCGFAPRGGIDFASLKTDASGWFGAGWWRYGQSKLANILYARALASHYPTITSVSVHPGTVATELVSKHIGFWNRLFVNVSNRIAMGYYPLPPHMGAYNTLWCATVDRGDLVSGGFYLPVGKKGKPPHASGEDDEVAEKLWAWTEDELKPFLI